MINIARKDTERRCRGVDSTKLWDYKSTESQTVGYRSGTFILKIQKIFVNNNIWLVNYYRNRYCRYRRYLIVTGIYLKQKP